MQRILVVDDDPDIREYFAAVLGDNGYQVEAVRDAASALARLETFHPDVIIVDVLLPGRSGLDLFVTLRRHPGWSSIPLVVITGVEQLLQDGCRTYLNSQNQLEGPDAVLGKPIDPPTLLTVLRAIEARAATQH